MVLHWWLQLVLRMPFPVRLLMLLLQKLRLRI